MALRLLQCVIPKRNDLELVELLKQRPAATVWRVGLDDELLLASILIDASEAEAVSDALREQFESLDGFRLVLLPVEAAVPKLDRPAPDASNEGSGGGGSEPAPAAGAAGSGGAAPRRMPGPSPRISREELLEDVASASAIGRVYIALSALSAVVASIGMARDNVAVVIGAMVIAPLLGPNIALALATTLADMKLLRRSLRANIVGAGAALAVALAFGLVLDVDPASGEIAARTRVTLGDVGLALASGAAGALAFTTGTATALVGVMVAVALVPPLVATGLLIGAGQWMAAWSAGLLVATNVVCVNLAGVVTFLIQGVRPQQWWAADRARRATRRAVAIWIALLVVLLVLLSRA